MKSRLQLLVSMRLNELTDKADQLIDQIAEKAIERNSLNQRKEELKHKLASLEAGLYLFLSHELPKPTVRDMEYSLERAKANSEEYQKYLDESNTVATNIANLGAEEQRLTRRFSKMSALIGLRTAQINFLAGEPIVKEE